MLVFYFNKLCWGFGLHSGDGGDVRERERERERRGGRETKIGERYKYILLYKYIILMYCIRK